MNCWELIIEPAFELLGISLTKEESVAESTVVEEDGGHAIERDPCVLDDVLKEGFEIDVVVLSTLWL